MNSWVRSYLLVLVVELLIRSIRRLESIDKYVVIVGDNCRAVILFIVMICEFLIALTYKDYNLVLTWDRYI